jgi:hypothetical protein
MQSPLSIPVQRDMQVSHRQTPPQRPSPVVKADLIGGYGWTCPICNGRPSALSYPTPQAAYLDARVHIRACGIRHWTP